MGCSPDNQDDRIPNPTVFTDTPLTINDMTVKAAHITELRTAIKNETVTRYNPSPEPWPTDPALAADGAAARVGHINDLNAASVAMHTPKSRCIQDSSAAPSLSDVTAGDDVVTSHINALRAYVNSQENVACFCDCDYVCVDKTDKTDRTDRSDKGDCGHNGADMC